MLVNFRFKNCRSFYKESLFSMEATYDTEYKEINTFSPGKKVLDDEDGRLLKSALVFGGNASGKSNLLKALNYMKFCVLFSGPNSLITDQNRPFALLEGAEDEESLYEVDFIRNDAFYRYGFTIEKGNIKDEWLKRRTDDKRLTSVFERRGNEYMLTGYTKNQVSLISTSPKTLFISAVSNFGFSKIRPYTDDVISWFNTVDIIFTNTRNSVRIYQNESVFRDKALKILKLADIGISSMQVVKKNLGTLENKDGGRILPFPFLGEGEFEKEEDNYYNIDLETDFAVYDKDGGEGGEKKVLLYKDGDFNSEGTKRLINYLGFVLVAIETGRVLLLDEIDSQLHFLVVDYVINMFNSIHQNPKNAQLIATAHNMALMDGNIRRDQIYFTSKDDKGQSDLSSLSDFKGVRKDDLFSKKYLAGFYANIPNMKRGLPEDA